MPDELPVACILGPEAIQARRAALLPGLIARAHARQDLPDGFRVSFPPEAEVLTAIVQTVDAERQCCQFLRFQITVEPVWGRSTWT